MERRRFIEVIAGGLLAAPLAAEAQSVGKAPRIACLFNSIPESAIAGPHLTDKYARAFLEQMRALGWIDGQNITIERRSAEGQPERITVLAQELMRRHVDLIVVAGSCSALQVNQLSPAIPISGLLGAIPGNSRAWGSPRGSLAPAGP